MSELPPQYGKYQLESGGYMRLVNQILEDLITAPFTSRQLRILLCVIRLTYGYKKKRRRISLERFADMTGLPLQHCSTEVKKLIAMNVMTRDTQRGEIGYQKYASRWQLPIRKGIRGKGIRVEGNVVYNEKWRQQS